MQAEGILQTAIDTTGLFWETLTFRTSKTMELSGAWNIFLAICEPRAITPG